MQDPYTGLLYYLCGLPNPYNQDTETTQPSKTKNHTYHTAYVAYSLLISHNQTTIHSPATTTQPWTRTMHTTLPLQAYQILTQPENCNKHFRKYTSPRARTIHTTQVTTPSQFSQPYNHTRSRHNPATTSIHNLFSALTTRPP